jgi:hypothetical protein
LSLCGRLTRLGAPPSTAHHLLEAIEADQVLSTGVAAGPAWVDPRRHPLAAAVHRWTITNLILWPIVGKRPQHLDEFVAKVPRRGPAPARPTLSAEERTRFLDHLLKVAERARKDSEALLRRQAVSLLGFDGRAATVDWLRAEWMRAGRTRPGSDDITALLEARSASVALAVAGDSMHLHDFVDRMTAGPAELANLNYWAYWIGELGEVQVSDDFMRKPDAGPWSGAQLLNHLVGRLEPGSPHLPLNLCTLHGLIASWPSLLSDRSDTRTSLGGVLDKLAVIDSLSRTNRQQLSGLQYALRIADRYKGKHRGTRR